MGFGRSGQRSGNESESLDRTARSAVVSASASQYEAAWQGGGGATRPVVFKWLFSGARLPGIFECAASGSTASGRSYILDSEQAGRVSSATTPSGEFFRRSTGQRDVRLALEAVTL